jgi:hypothetical protein
LAHAQTIYHTYLPAGPLDGSEVLGPIYQQGQDRTVQSAPLVGTTPYRATGANAARSNADRFADTANLRDFGAICDGKSHPLSQVFKGLTLEQVQKQYYPAATATTQEIDTAALQAAINAGTRQIIWPVAVCIRDPAGVTGASNQVIKGQGDGLSVWRLLAPATGIGLYYPANFTHFAIRDLTFDDNNMSGNQATIAIRNSTDFRIQDNEIIHGVTFGVSIGTSYDFRVVGNRFQKDVPDGTVTNMALNIFQAGGTGPSFSSKHAWVEDNRSINWTFTESTTQGIIYKNNIITGHGYGAGIDLASHGGSQGVQDCSENVIEGNIVTDGAPGVVDKDNTSVTGIETNCSYSAHFGNIFARNDGGGITTYGQYSAWVGNVTYDNNALAPGAYASAQFVLPGGAQNLASASYNTIVGNVAMGTGNIPPIPTGTITFDGTTANVTWTAHGLNAGDLVQFTTTGTLPSNITNSAPAGSTFQSYKVLATNLTANTFQMAACGYNGALGHCGTAAIIPNGAGSGTHTGTRVGSSQYGIRNITCSTLHDANGNDTGMTVPRHNQMFGNVTEPNNIGMYSENCVSTPGLPNRWVYDNTYDGPSIGSQHYAWNPGTIANGATATDSWTVPGAAFGDFVRVSFGASLQNCTLSAYVSAPNTVVVTMVNNTGAAVTFSSGVQTRVLVQKNRDGVTYQ